MKYPVIYVHNQLGVFKHGKVVGTLAASLEAEDRFLEEDPQLRKAYLDRVNKDMMRALEGQFVIAQATRINVEGKEYLMFKDNLDQRMLKQQLQMLVNEFSNKAQGYQVTLRYAVFKSLLKIKDRDLFLAAMKEGEPLGQSNIAEEKSVVLKVNQSRAMTNYLTPLSLFQQHK